MSTHDEPTRLTRREFLRLFGLAGGAVLLGVSTAGCTAPPEQTQQQAQKPYPQITYFELTYSALDFASYALKHEVKGKNFNSGQWTASGDGDEKQGTFSQPPFVASTTLPKGKVNLDLLVKSSDGIESRLVANGDKYHSSGDRSFSMKVSLQKDGSKLSVRPTFSPEGNGVSFNFEDNIKWLPNGGAYQIDLSKLRKTEEYDVGISSSIEEDYFGNRWEYYLSVPFKPSAL